MLMYQFSNLIYLDKFLGIFLIYWENHIFADDKMITN